MFYVEIDCGSLDGELVGLKTLPSMTTYGATFTFECGPGFRLVGNNSRHDNVVSCMVTGRWDLGGLGCVGAWYITTSLKTVTTIDVQLYVPLATSVDTTGQIISLLGLSFVHTCLLPAQCHVHM